MRYPKHLTLQASLLLAGAAQAASITDVAQLAPGGSAVVTDTFWDDSQVDPTVTITETWSFSTNTPWPTLGTAAAGDNFGPFHQSNADLLGGGDGELAFGFIEGTLVTLTGVYGSLGDSTVFKVVPKGTVFTTALTPVDGMARLQADTKLLADLVARGDQLAGQMYAGYSVILEHTGLCDVLVNVSGVNGAGAYLGDFTEYADFVDISYTAIVAYAPTPTGWDANVYFRIDPQPSDDTYTYYPTGDPLKGPPNGLRSAQDAYLSTMALAGLYGFALVTDVAGPQGASFSWATGPWSSCSQTCGGGSRTRAVLCIDDATGGVVGEIHCTDPKPNREEVCNGQPCTSWSVGEWSDCSAPCGGGFRTRDVGCVEESTGNAVPDAQCDGLKPAGVAVCNTEECPTYSWVIGEWGTCSATCGEGLRSRAVACVEDGTGAIAADVSCTEPKPPAEEACHEGACEWRAGTWGACAVVCDGGLQTRAVVCVSAATQQVTDDAACEAATKPVDFQACNEEPCADLYSWEAGEWTDCDRACEGGSQTRTVECVDAGGEAVTRGLCESDTEPSARQACNELPCSRAGCQQLAGGDESSRRGSALLLLAAGLWLLRRRAISR